MCGIKKEYNALELLLNGLKSGSLLPPGIRAKTLVPGYPFQVSGQRSQPDAIVEFTLNRSVSTSITAVIELKSRLQPMGLEGAIHQILRFRNELHRSGAYQDLYPMLAATYISESVQIRCKELGVGYIDLNGTLALIHKDVYVDVVRPATAFKNPQGIKNFFPADHGEFSASSWSTLITLIVSSNSRLKPSSASDRSRR
jgi:hypothetical protein